MRDYVRAEAGPFADRVVLLDPMRHAQLYPFIENASFVVLPSLVDNMPNTLLETMGHRRVAIATTGSCFEQLIDSGRTGFLVPPGDPTALAAAMTQVHELPIAVREEIGRAARERVELLHPDRAIPMLMKYYQSVVQSHRRVPNRITAVAQTA